MTQTPIDPEHVKLPGHTLNNDHYTYFPRVPIARCTDPRACPDPCHRKA